MRRAGRSGAGTGTRTGTGAGLGQRERGRERAGATFCCSPLPGQAVLVPMGAVERIRGVCPAADLPAAAVRGRFGFPGGQAELGEPLEAVLDTGDAGGAEPGGGHAEG